MEEVLNKPDDQFEDTLIDLCDYGKETSEKEALIKEFYQNETANHHQIKPAASINSSTYSSAASSSSSSSSSSTNSASSTSSTLSSPSQSNPIASKSSNDQSNDNQHKANGNELEEVEMAILEDLGKTATIVEHRSNDNPTTRYLRNLVTGPIHFHDSSARYRAAAEQTKIRSVNHTFMGPKITGPRKKRPTQQPVLSQHIPGHKGEQEVDWLVRFIEVSLHPYPCQTMVSFLFFNKFVSYTNRILLLQYDQSIIPQWPTSLAALISSRRTKKATPTAVQTTIITVVAALTNEPNLNLKNQLNMIIMIVTSKHPENQIIATPAAHLTASRLPPASRGPRKVFCLADKHLSHHHHHHQQHQQRQQHQH